MAYTHAQAREVESRIIRELGAKQTELETAKAAFAKISSDLAAMQTNYAGWAGDVNTLFNANNTNPELIALKSSLDLLVAQFTSSKNEADALDTVVNS